MGEQTVAVHEFLGQGGKRRRIGLVARVGAVKQRDMEVCGNQQGEADFTPRVPLALTFCWE